MFIEPSRSLFNFKRFLNSLGWSFYAGRKKSPLCTCGWKSFLFFEGVVPGAVWWSFLLCPVFLLHFFGTGVFLGLLMIFFRCFSFCLSVWNLSWTADGLLFAKSWGVGGYLKNDRHWWLGVTFERVWCNLRGVQILVISFWSGGIMLSTWLDVLFSLPQLRLEYQDRLKWGGCP